MNRQGKWATSAGQVWRRAAVWAGLIALACVPRAACGQQSPGPRASEDSAVLAAPFFRQLRPVFGRGVNLGNALEAPEEGQWGVVLKEEYFQKIHAAGFDSVRIPVRWSAHAGQSAPYRIDPKFFARVDWAIRQALRQRLTPVVNMHNYDEIFVEPDQHRGRFLALWRQIAEHYKDFPASLALELLNEPHAKLTAEKWNRLAAEAIVSVRRSNPTRQIVVGPVGWNSINELPKLELPEGDRHLVVTVHYYNPFQFTHQGTRGSGRSRRSGWGRSGRARRPSGRPSGGTSTRPSPGRSSTAGRSTWASSGPTARPTWNRVPAGPALSPPRPCAARWVSPIGSSVRASASTTPSMASGSGRSRRPS